MASDSRALTLKLLADVADFQRKIDSANNDVESFSGKIEKFGKMAAAAFAAAAAAAAAYATKLAIDGVKAAIEDEAAQKRLAESLKSATGATQDQIDAVEKQILSYQLAYGVSDKDLRPALQRLALSTNDLTKAQDILSTALDVAAATGKPLESVTNAIAKAYDGSNTALARLGVGLSAAELKSMSFKQVQDQLNATFGGAAQAQANTYQGQIARLTQTFEEAKETVGARLLPIIQTLIDVFITKVLPTFDKFASAFDPIRKAISDNKETFKDFGEFIVTYIVPVLVGTLGTGLKTVGTIAGAVIDVIAGVINAVKSAVSFAIDGINALIKAYNAIPLLPNIPTISKPNASQFVPSGSSGANVLPKVEIPQIVSPVPTPTKTTGTSTSSLSNVVVPSVPQPIAAAEQPTYNYFNITGAIDPEASARQIIDILNQSGSRGGAGSNTMLMV